MKTRSGLCPFVSVWRKTSWGPSRLRVVAQYILLPVDDLFGSTQLKLSCVWRRASISILRISRAYVLVTQNNNNWNVYYRLGFWFLECAIFCSQTSGQTKHKSKRQHISCHQRNQQSICPLFLTPHLLLTSPPHITWSTVERNGQMHVF